MKWSRKEIAVWFLAAIFALGMALVLFAGRMVKSPEWNAISLEQISLVAAGGILSLLSGGGLVAEALEWSRGAKEERLGREEPKTSE